MSHEYRLYQFAMADIRAKLTLSPLPVSELTKLWGWPLIRTLEEAGDLLLYQQETEEGSTGYVRLLTFDTLREN